jgi:predicted ABC-type ATPase
MAESSPTVIVLGGPNGAGKTTSARTLLANRLSLLTFVNADVIAQGLAGFDPDSAALEASRIMLERLYKLADQRADFAFETTLAARSYAPWLNQLRASGFTVHLFYFWLASADLAVARVAQRVRQGGHNIPEPVIRQRYDRSLDNFFDLYRSAVTSWDFFDNTDREPGELVASGDDQGNEVVHAKAKWDRVRQERPS